MKDLGFNVARVGLSWDLYETKPGIFDETYLDFVEAQALAILALGKLRSSITCSTLNMFANTVQLYALHEY